MKAATPMLDRSRDHGTIYPPLADGSRFAQDGKHFDFQGNYVREEIEQKGSKMPTNPDDHPANEEAVQRPVAVPATSTPEAPKQFTPIRGIGKEPALEQGVPAGAENVSISDPANVDQDKDAVDLRSWAMGANCGFFEVKKQFLATHPNADAKKLTAKTIVKALIDEGIVTEAEVTR